MDKYISRLNEKTGKREILIFDNDTLVTMLEVSQEDSEKTILDAYFLDECFKSSKRRKVSEEGISPTKRVYNHFAFEINNEMKESLETRFPLCDEQKENIEYSKRKVLI